jgi:N-dimethylarginine dimethylaminohydrolase
MDRERPADRELASSQWQDLRRLVQAAGAAVELVTPAPGFPDMVFTANAGLIYGRQVVLSRFRPPQRRGEEPCFAAWFAERGFALHRLPEDCFFEGAGDALFCGDTLFAGYRLRSDARVHQEIGAMLGCRVIPLEMVDQHFYHLDTCFCPLTRDAALYYPAAFDEYGRRALADCVPRLIEVDEDEAARFAVNAVVVGKTVVANTGCPRLVKSLRSLGFDPVETPLDEFVKAGGGAKCLTLRLDGEEAAAWQAGLDDGSQILASDAGN